MGIGTYRGRSKFTENLSSSKIYSKSLNTTLDSVFPILKDLPNLLISLMKSLLKVSYIVLINLNNKKFRKFLFFPKTPLIGHKKE